MQKIQNMVLGCKRRKMPSLVNKMANITLLVLVHTNTSRGISCCKGIKLVEKLQNTVFEIA